MNETAEHIRQRTGLPSEVRVSISEKAFRTPRGVRSVLGAVEFELRPRGFVCLLGPSGCGKTTILRIVSGLDGDFAGSVSIEGRPFGESGHRCHVVFQESRLLPWKTTRQNVEFALPRDLDVVGQRRLADEALAMVGMADQGHLWPRQLSGGMMKRAALARALVLPPAILALDEPFSALDSWTKRALQNRVYDLHVHLETSTLMVTHDIDEALQLSDRIILLSGRPSRISATVAVELPRPRHPSQAGYYELRERLASLVDGVSTDGAAS